MKTNLYIPKTLKIGFQKRTDTFTGKLAYVIYYDDKKKLRKETSWKSWCDKDIPSVEISNDPTDGFTMNKGFTRYSDWGSGRAVIRIWDPRDFEFEIALDNLVGILMHSNVSKREIDEKCVFAWNGPELVLLPCNTQEYQESVKFTEKQAKKFSAKDLVPGYTYMPKKEDDPVIYLGRFEEYETKSSYSNYSNTSSRQHLKGKKHWFASISGNNIFTKEPATYLAATESEEIHTEFANKLEALHSTTKAQKIVGFSQHKLDSSFKIDGDRYDQMFYIPVKDNVFIQMSISTNFYRYDKMEVSAYHLMCLHEDGTIDLDWSERYYSYGYGHTKPTRQSCFGLTLDSPEVKALAKEITEDYPESLFENNVRPTWRDNFAEQNKKAMADFAKKTVLDMYPNAVTLKWVLENGKETKGIYGNDY